MGWNAYAIDSNGNSIVHLQDGTTLASKVDGVDFEIPGVDFENETIAVAFQEASDYVFQITGKDADRFLKYSGLDLPGAVEMLQIAANSPIPTEGIWDFNFISELSNRINWGFPPDPKSFTEYWSARAFYNVCVTLGLGIKFFPS